jgi:hypothetical protein
MGGEVDPVVPTSHQPGQPDQALAALGRDVESGQLCQSADQQIFRQGVGIAQRVPRGTRG